MRKTYDTIIIGGGFYGLRIAQFLYDELGIRRILIIEKEKEMMTRASYNNQARVHNGYHYPRSVLTALRSKVNSPIFSKEYEPAIESDFIKYYAIAKLSSKVNARQYQRFFERIGAEIKPAPEARQYFNPRLVEEVFLTKEYAFNAVKLRDSLLEKLSNRVGIDIKTNEKVERVSRQAARLNVVTDRSSYLSKRVLNTTYSSINLINQASALPVIPLKHELTEMCLVELPEELAGKAFTLMCGPFFSLMPFPSRGAYTLSHVRYTPHSERYDDSNNVKANHTHLRKINKAATHFPQMYADTKRYMPIAEKMKYLGESLWETKTVLPRSEADDSRPILYAAHHGGLANYTCIMGAKIDNIYDVFRELKRLYAD